MKPDPHQPVTPTTRLFQTITAAGLSPDWHTDDLQHRDDGGYDWFCCLFDPPRRIPYKRIDAKAREILGGDYIPGSAQRPRKRHWPHQVQLSLRETYRD